jgi:hypothetical protein
MQIDPKLIAAGIGAIGLAAGAGAGLVKITTPEAAQCAVDLAATNARMEGLIEIKESCKSALELCLTPNGEEP